MQDEDAMACAKLKSAIGWLSHSAKHNTLGMGQNKRSVQAIQCCLRSAAVT
jgi:hypothetical protein